jgi:hypothetical protein
LGFLVLSFDGKQFARFFDFLDDIRLCRLGHFALLYFVV